LGETISVQTSTFQIEVRIEKRSCIKGVLQRLALERVLLITQSEFEELHAMHRQSNDATHQFCQHFASIAYLSDHYKQLAKLYGIHCLEDSCSMISPNKVGSA